MDYRQAGLVRVGSRLRAKVNLRHFDRTIKVPKGSIGTVVQVMRVELRYEFIVDWRVNGRLIREMIAYRRADPVVSGGNIGDTVGEVLP